MAAKTKKLSQPIGSIVTSMLTEVQFQSINGDDWVLADGRSVIGTVYETVTALSTLPDLRGVTLRGKNNGRIDGNEDPDGERALGSFQNHGTASHTHTQRGSNSSVQAGSGLINAPLAATTNTGVNSGAANETRAKNVAINYFIKVN